MAGKGGDIRAGSAFIELAVKDGKLRRGLALAKATLARFGTAVAITGAAAGSAASAAFGGILASAKKFADSGSELHDLAERTGVAASRLAELGYAAEQSGATLEDVEKGLRHMAKEGIPVEKFDELAQSIAGIQDPTLRANAALQTWGRTGTALIPMLADLEKLSAEARAYGLVPTEQAIQDADSLGDAFHRLDRVIGGAVKQLGAVFAPIVEGGVTGLAKLVVIFRDWAKTNESVIGTLRGIGQALAGEQWQLAGQILFNSIALAIEKLTAFIGGTVGDLAHRLIQGDLTGAWKTVVLKMAEIWSAFSTGVVETFSVAAKAVIGVWKTSIKAIAHTMLDMAKQPTLMGRGLSKLLGVDVMRESAREKELNNALALDNEKSAADGVIESETKRLTEPIQGFFDALRETALQSAEVAQGELQAHLAAGAKEREGVIDDLRQQLAALHKEVVPIGAGAAGAGAAAAGGGLSSEALGFSASAALLRGSVIGGANSHGERMASGVEKLVAQGNKHLQALDELKKTGKPRFASP